MSDEINQDDITFEADPDNNPAQKSSFARAGESDQGHADADLVAQITSLKEKITNLQEEKQKYLDNWQRAQADFLNIRRRDEEDKKQYMKFASQGLIEDIIPVLSNFDMAKSNTEHWEKVDTNWRTGIESIFKQLKDTLASQGLKEVDPLGEAFNPALHEAIGHEVVTDTSKQNTITRVVQKGYALHDKIIKAPRVLVGELSQ